MFFLVWGVLGLGLAWARWASRAIGPTRHGTRPLGPCLGRWFRPWAGTARPDTPDGPCRAWAHAVPGQAARMAIYSWDTPPRSCPAPKPNATLVGAIQSEMSGSKAPNGASAASGKLEMERGEEEFGDGLAKNRMLRSRKDNSAAFGPEWLNCVHE